MHRRRHAYRALPLNRLLKPPAGAVMPVTGDARHLGLGSGEQAAGDKRTEPSTHNLQPPQVCTVQDSRRCENDSNTRECVTLGVAGGVPQG